MHDESDCSSAEDERRNRQQHASSAPRVAAATSAASAAAAAVPAGKKQKNSHGLVSPPPPMNCSQLVEMQEMPYHLIPKMKSMSELLHDAPHLTMNPFDGSPICQEAKDKVTSGQTSKRKEPSPEAPAAVVAAAAAAAMMFDENPRALASPGTEDLTKALAAARIAQQPDLQGHWVKNEFEKRIAALPRPEFYDPDNPLSSISQKQLEDELRRGRKVLPLQSVELESHLLAEAGTFVHKTNATKKELFFPPCSNGDKCRGMTSRLRGQTRPCIFTMLLFDREYYYLINSGLPPPAEVKRPCVLCCRHDIVEAVTFDRQMRMQGETRAGGVQSSVLPLQHCSGEIVQFYRNRMDCEGGYDRKHMLVTNHDPDDPILEPICMPGRSEIFCVESELLVHKGENGLPRIVVDQKKLLWKAPPKPVPSIGQNLLNFCGGAGNY
jgi:hypothetical protein